MLFEGAHSFHIEDNKIIGIVANTQEETLKFDSPILIEGRPETISKAIEEQKRAVKREIQGAVNLVNSNVSVIDLFNSEFINQAVEVADLINNTEIVENACKTAGKEKDFQYLDKLREQMSEKVNLLSNESKKEFSPTKRTRLNCLIILNVELLNWIEQVLLEKCKKHGIPSYGQSWNQHARFYWQDDVLFKLDAYEMNYGYEYLGI